MRRAGAIGLLVLLWCPSPVAGQVVSGVADWTYGRATIDAGQQSNLNTTFTQSYTLGYRSVIWDPRFLNYTAQLMFQKMGLLFSGQEGQVSNTGYKLGASLFPARPFPLSISASRSFGGESGNYPASSTASMRGGLVLPAGIVAPQFRTRQSSLGVNWQLVKEALPRLEVGYNKGSAGVSLGDLAAEQRDSTFTASMLHEGARTQNTLRFQRTGFSNLASQEFDQRLTDLNYELRAALGRGVKSNVRAGYRRMYSLFDAPPQFTDIGRGGYLPPAAGSFGQYYAVGSVTYQLRSALLTDVTTSYDRSTFDQGSTESLLVLSTTRYEPLRGLTLSGTASYGSRGQDLSGSRLATLTRSVLGGAAYNLPLRLIQASVGVERGTGQNSGSAGEAPGRTDSWTERASVASPVLRWVEVSAAYERARATDDLISFGNYSIETTRASAQSRATNRIRLYASWERSLVDRGIRETFSRAEFLNRNGGAEVDLGGRRRLGLTAGQFWSRSDYSIDRNTFYGLSYNSYVFNRVRLAFSARRDEVVTRAVNETQVWYYTMAEAEYRLRLFTFALEHRYTTFDLVTSTRAHPFLFVGNQLLLRISRRFGFGL